MIQIPIIVVILFFALRELYNIFVDIDVNLFNMYSDKLTVTNIMIQEKCTSIHGLQVQYLT